uniref:SH2 domain-containing protein n=1 Tax=Macrostomum lignano TaxID=282301 RepID=A0A1I8FBZ7_9PLAT
VSGNGHGVASALVNARPRAEHGLHSALQQRQLPIGISKSCFSHTSWTSTNRPVEFRISSAGFCSAQTFQTLTRHLQTRAWQRKPCPVRFGPRRFPMAGRACCVSAREWQPSSAIAYFCSSQKQKLNALQRLRAQANSAVFRRPKQLAMKRLATEVHPFGGGKSSPLEGKCACPPGPPMPASFANAWTLAPLRRQTTIGTASTPPAAIVLAWKRHLPAGRGGGGLQPPASGDDLKTALGQHPHLRVPETKFYASACEAQRPRPAFDAGSFLPAVSPGDFTTAAARRRGLKPGGRLPVAGSLQQQQNSSSSKPPPPPASAAGDGYLLQRAVLAAAVRPNFLIPSAMNLPCRLSSSSAAAVQSGRVRDVLPEQPECQPALMDRYYQAQKSALQTRGPSTKLPCCRSRSSLPLYSCEFQETPESTGPFYHSTSCDTELQK